VFANTISDNVVDQILAVAKRFARALEESQISYRIVGGLACYLHVHDVNSMPASITSNVDIAILRSDAEAVADAAIRAGFLSLDGGMGFRLEQSRIPVRVLFVGEWVHPYNAEAMPASPPVRSSEGFYIASVADLVRMKLTALRLQDKLHIQELDSAGLITRKVEAGLPPMMRKHLVEIRATE
jgi:hypothetical protein